jgi:hypothetical protein
VFDKESFNAGYAKGNSSKLQQLKNYNIGGFKPHLTPVLSSKTNNYSKYKVNNNNNHDSFNESYRKVATPMRDTTGMADRLLQKLEISKNLNKTLTTDIKDPIEDIEKKLS